MSSYSVHHASKQSPARGTAVRIALLSGFGMLFLTMLLFLSAYLALQKDWSGVMLSICMYTCSAVSAFFVGFACAKIVPKRKAIYSLLSVVPVLLLLAILCLALYGKIGAGYLIDCGVILLSASLGSVVSIARKKKRKYKTIASKRKN